ncbi:MAG: MFS transporter [Alphaproteobacteria bacterium]|nr:MFS transporter [Alphaproteobacteria bacterium]
MIAVLPAVAALLLGVAFLMPGNGLQGTLLGVRGAIESFSAIEIGLVMSGYYAGFALACLFGAAVIERVGHIRTFAAFASLASAAAIVHAAIVDPWSWIVLRALTGACFAGLYMVVESWLNDRISNSQRGSLMAVYMIVNLGSIAAAQQLLNISNPAGFELFVVSSVLISLAAIPVALTTSTVPAPVRADRMRFSDLYLISPLGVMGAFVTGLANGAMWGLIPLAGIRFGLTTAAVATFMSLIVLGGVAFQWPTGWLSDRVDRRKVIALASAILIASSGALYVVAGRDQNVLFAIGFVFGGMSLVLYPLCAAHTNDRVSSDQRVASIAALLLVLGVGAAVGPLLGALTMEIFGARSVFLFIAGILTLFLLFALVRIREGEAVPVEDQSPFEPVVLTSASTILDPWVEPEESGTSA